MLRPFAKSSDNDTWPIAAEQAAQARAGLPCVTSNSGTMNDEERNEGRQRRSQKSADEGGRLRKLIDEDSVCQAAIPFLRGGLSCSSKTSYVSFRKSVISSMPLAPRETYDVLLV